MRQNNDHLDHPDNPEIQKNLRRQLGDELKQLTEREPALAWLQIVQAAEKRRKQHTFRLIAGLATAAVLVFAILPVIYFSQIWQPDHLPAGTTGTAAPDTSRTETTATEPGATHTTRNTDTPSTGTVAPNGNGSSLADMIAMVSIRGQWYSTYQMITAADQSITKPPILGDIIATVDFQYADEFTKAPANPEQLVVSTCLPKGTKVRAIQGFDPSFRVGSQDAEGNIWVFQRYYHQAQITGKIGEVIDLGSHVRAVIRYDQTRDQEIGRLVQTGPVSQIASLLLQAAIRQGSSTDNQTGGQYFKLLLDDETTVNFNLDPNNLLRICGLTATSPDGLKQLLQPLLDAGNSDQARILFNTTGNGLLVSGFQYDSNLEGSGRDDAWLADAYIDLAGSQGLYLSGGLQLGNRILAAQGPVKDLQLWQDHYYLINAAGQVVRLGGTALETDNYAESWKLKGMTDLSQSAETAIADPGPASRLRVWQGQLLILRPNGQLDLNGQVLQKGVTWFEIDSTGLIFMDAKGLGRLSLTNRSQPARYWAGTSTLAAAPAGGAICYANNKGLFYQPLRDEPALKLSDLTLEQLVCDGQGYCYGINSQGLWQVSLSGQSRLLRAGKIRTFGLGFGDGALLFVEEGADGSLEVWSTDTYPSAETWSQTDRINQYQRK